jgi:hypothetical protein
MVFLVDFSEFKRDKIQKIQEKLKEIVGEIFKIKLEKKVIILKGPVENYYLRGNFVLDNNGEQITIETIYVKTVIKIKENFNDKIKQYGIFLVNGFKIDKMKIIKDLFSIKIINTNEINMLFARSKVKDFQFSEKMQWPIINYIIEQIKANLKKIERKKLNKRTEVKIEVEEVIDDFYNSSRINGFEKHFEKIFPNIFQDFIFLKFIEKVVIIKKISILKEIEVSDKRYSFGKKYNVNYFFLRDRSKFIEDFKKIYLSRNKYKKRVEQLIELMKTEKVTLGKKIITYYDLLKKIDNSWNIY